MRFSQYVMNKYGVTEKTAHVMWEVVHDSVKESKKDNNTSFMRGVIFGEAMLAVSFVITDMVMAGHNAEINSVVRIIHAFEKKADV